jgi:hypothetical protein
MGDYAELGWAARPMDVWGHCGARVLVVAVLAAIVLGVRPPPPGTALALYLPLALLVVVVVSWLLMRRHDRHPCELCAQEMPLNAAELADGMRASFAVAHAGERRPLVIGYLLVLAASNVLLLAGPLGKLVWAVAQSSMIYLVLAYSNHRRFQPWCPRCGGGEEYHDADLLPGPAPHGVGA